MSRLAKSSKPDYLRARRLAPDAERNTLVSAAGLASSSLMPAGCGLEIPRLGPVPIEQQLWDGERAAARLARNFLEVGIADAADWIAANRKPFAFLKRGLALWLAAHGEPVIREQFFIDVLLSTDLDRYFASESKSLEISRLFIALEPDCAGYVVLGPTLELLENIHARLPSTFLHLFLSAINNWVRVYDFCCRQQKSYFVAIPVMWRSDT